MDRKPRIVIDLHQHIATRDGERIVLQRKTFDLLVFFARNSDRLLTKEAILRGVWPDTHVTEGSVKDVVMQLRRTLADDPSNPDFIATERGIGYRFLGNVTFSENGTLSNPAFQQGSEIATSTNAPHAGPVRRQSPGLSSRRIVLAVVAAIVLLGAFLSFENVMNRDVSFVHQPTVAVLPFDNLSSDPDHDYLAEGITDDLITELSQLSGLFVIARNSTEVYVDRTTPLKRIAEELEVRYLLQGSVQHSGNRLRINAQLVDTDSGQNLWAERFDAPAGDMLELQTRITGRIADALELQLSEFDVEQLNRRETSSATAHDYVLRGHLLFRRLTPQDNAAAQEMFESALEIDPDYARAEALLGWSHWMATVSGWDTKPLEVALSHADQALALDGRLASALALKGKVLLWQQQHADAEQELRNAVSLVPGDYSAQGHLGDILVWSGKPDEAFVPLERSLRLSPNDNGWILTLMGLAHFFAERNEDALETLNRSLVRNPEYFWAHLIRAAVLGEMGRHGEANLALQNALDVNPEFSLEFLVSAAPFRRDKDRQRVVNGLRIAGLDQ